MFPCGFTAKSFWRCFTHFAPFDWLFWNQYLIFFYKGKGSLAGTAQLAAHGMASHSVFPWIYFSWSALSDSICVLYFKKMLVKLHPWKGGVEPTKRYYKQMRFLTCWFSTTGIFGAFLPSPFSVEYFYEFIVNNLYLHRRTDPFGTENRDLLQESSLFSLPQHLPLEIQQACLWNCRAFGSLWLFDGISKSSSGCKKPSCYFDIDLLLFSSPINHLYQHVAEKC